MKSILTLLILILYQINVAQAPQYEWSYKIPTRVYYSQGVRTGPANEVYTFGTFTGTVDLDPGPGVYTATTSSSTSFLVKLDQQGNFIWAKTINASPTDLFIDDNGCPVLTGYFSGTVDFDPGAGVQSFTCAGSTNGFVLKLNNSGSFLWAQHFKGDAYCQPEALCADDAGNILITGNYNGTVDFDPGPGTFSLNQGGMYNTAGFVCKLNVNGNFVWAKNFASLAMSGTGITTDNAGNVYFTGRFADTVDFDPGIGVFKLCQQQFQIFACKLSPYGDFIWAGEFGGYAADFAGKIAIDSKKNMYISGYLKGSGDVDPGPGVVTVAVAPKWVPGFIAKLDSVGNFIAVLAEGAAGRWPQALAVDSVDNLYVTGVYSDSLDLDGGPGTTSFTVNGGDIFISKLNDSLQLQWAGIISGDADAYPTMAVDRWQNIFIQGLFTNTLDCNPAAPVNALSTGTVPIGYLLKLSSGKQPPPPSTTAVSESVRIGNGIKLFPNPTNGTCMIQTSDQPIESICLMDVSGKIFQVPLHKEEVDITILPAGIYILFVSTASETFRTRIVKY